jgi:hypothetical protein
MPGQTPVPIVQLSALLPPWMERELIRRYEFGETVKTIRSPFTIRKNVHYIVENIARQGALGDRLLYHLLEWEPLAGCALIFAGTKRRLNEIAKLIPASIKFVMFTSDQTIQEQEDLFTGLKTSKYPTIVLATEAFGAAVNLPDIRLCIHYGGARSVFVFANQVGRMVRTIDGSTRQIGKSVLLFNDALQWNDWQFGGIKVDGDAVVEYAQAPCKVGFLHCFLDGVASLTTCWDHPDVEPCCGCVSVSMVAKRTQTHTLNQIFDEVKTIEVPPELLSEIRDHTRAAQTFSMTHRVKLNSSIERARSFIDKRVKVRVNACSHLIWGDVSEDCKFCDALCPTCQSHSHGTCKYTGDSPKGLCWTCGVAGQFGGHPKKLKEVCHSPLRYTRAMAWQVWRAYKGMDPILELPVACIKAINESNLGIDLLVGPQAFADWMTNGNDLCTNWMLLLGVVGEFNQQIKLMHYNVIESFPKASQSPFHKSAKVQVRSFVIFILLKPCSRHVM